MCLSAEQVDESVVAKMSQQGDGLGQWLALSPEDAHPEVCTVTCPWCACAKAQALPFHSWVFHSWLGCLGSSCCGAPHTAATHQPRSGAMANRSQGDRPAAVPPAPWLLEWVTLRLRYQLP